MKLASKSKNFLSKHRIGVLATLLKNGSPHTSSVHYAESKSGEVYIMTEKNTMKSEALANGSPKPASFVTGFSDEEWATLQMDGVISVVGNKKDLAKVHRIYFAKNPFPQKYKNDPATIFLKFIPYWFRYTEFKPKYFVETSN